MEHTLTIDKVVYGGSGLARIDNKICFVPYVCPGEEVVVRITEDKKDYMIGVCIEVLKASPMRTQAKCSYYQQCGGCHYQHISYEEQLRIKQEQLVEVFRRIFGEFSFPVHPVCSSQKMYAYRNNVKLSRDSNRLGFRYGMVKTNQKSVITIDECCIADDIINKAIKELPQNKERHASKLTIKSAPGGHVSYWPGEAERLEVSIQGKPFYFDARVFFQPNPEILNEIVLRLKMYSEIKKGGCLFDLYAGVGVFGICLEEFFEKIVVIEENRKAVKYLEKTIHTALLRPEKFIRYRQSVEEVFKNVFEKESGNRNVIFLDPPRSGVDKDLICQIHACEEKIQSIFYLSCHPPTLARDLARLVDNKKWIVKEILPFDMFPQTKHMECLACITKRDAENI